MRQQVRGRWRLVLAGSLLLLAVPGVAAAHAVLVSSSPAPGETLGTAPGVVTLDFSEPLEPRTSQATVVDPSGSSFSGKASGSTIVVPMATNAPGTYSVSWTSVSASDGHTEHGSFEFSIQSTGPAGARSSAGGAGGPGIAVLRWVEYLALLIAIGMLVIRALTRRDPALEWVRLRPTIPLVVLFFGSLAVAIGDALVSSGSPSVHTVLAYLTSERPGTARVVVVGAALVAVIASVAGWLVWPVLLVALIALAMSGHAAAIHPAWWGISVDAVHLLAAGVWAGGILTFATLRPPDGWSSGQARALLDRFSPVAITAFLVTVTFGLIQALQNVGNLGAIFTSSYGRILGVKVLAVALMIPLSALAWRRKVAPKGEALIALVVVGASALLSTSPLPMTLAQRGAPRSNNSTVVSALPLPGDLTLGSHAGQVLVGLTLRPAKPGPNRAFVYLLPIQGSAAALHATFKVGRESVGLDVCGPNCREASIHLAGGEKITVDIAGPSAGTASFAIPRLPAPNGAALLAKAQQRMHALKSFRLSEVLNSGLATITTHYEFQAPDRMASQSSGGSSIVLIGGTRYLRAGSSKPWQVQRGGPPLPVPSFIWDYFKPFVDPRVLGAERLDGVPTKIVAFFGASGGTPVWFRLWIDAHGLVHQAQMRADGHFMDHRYSAFDAPIRIAPPPGVGAGG